MNFNTAMLLFLCWQLLKNVGSDKSANGAVLEGILSDDAKNLLASVGKLGDPKVSGEEKTGAILGVVTNPAAIGLAQSFFGAKADNSADVNDEGYRFSDDCSAEARNFFKPVENVAGAEAAHKLYSVYDNFYNRKPDK